MDLPTILIGGFFWLCGLAFLSTPFWFMIDIKRPHTNKKRKKELVFPKKSSIEKVYLIIKFTIWDPKLFFGVFSTKRNAEKFVKNEDDWQMVNCDIRLINGLYYVLHDEFTHISKICYSLEEAEANFKTDYEMVKLLECYVDNPSKDHCIKEYDDMKDPEVIKRMIRLAEKTVPYTVCNPIPFPKPQHSITRFSSIKSSMFVPPLPTIFM